MAKDDLAGLNGAAVERETAVLRLRLAHDQKLALLLPDVGTLSALSVVQGLDWLLLAGIPVQIPDRAAEETRQRPDLPGARAISDWIERNVVSGSVSIVRTDPDYDRRQQFAAWVAGGIDPVDDHTAFIWERPRYWTLSRHSKEDEGIIEKPLFWSTSAMRAGRLRKSPTSKSFRPAPFSECSRITTF
ncbi:hypothetical protein IVB22_11380 [Bradyrhizobium sp. 190]|uniref:hypothetical protein n=1 Tax=Bradyrhizobium sp. 190 TaxID=2782658 RepID=UPI001FFB53F9|nr:hypothetical protein [Bradyrhizobium sp. 190]MCK1513161.1 hypothetical protein [Bradyrhizobium sp. 190]